MFMKETVPETMKSFEILGQCLLFFSLITMSSTLDMITPTQPIRDGKNENNGTLVSTNGTFEAGFFSSESSNNRYFGIWYKDIFPRTVVWVANRETPLKHHSGVLELATDDVQGNTNILWIKDATGAKIWSSNASSLTPNKQSLVVVLLESGNMVVNDGDNNLLWQSFDYPGDTLLPGMKIGVNFRTGQNRALRSSKSLEDPTPGKFSFGVDPHGLPQLVITKDNGSNGIAYRPGSWNGLSVTGLPQEITDPYTRTLFVMNQDEVFYEIQLLNSSTKLRSRLVPQGYQIRLIWSDQNKRWDIHYPGSFDACETYDLCGANSICNSNGTDKHCECLSGYKPKSDDSTCARPSNLDCNKGVTDKFLKHGGMKLPDTSSSWYDRTISLQECEKLCLRNCSCIAYAPLDISGEGSGCLHWFSDILDIRTLPQGGQDFYLRTATVTGSELQSQDERFNRKKLAGIVVGCIVFIAITLFGLIFCIRRNKLNQSETKYWKDKGKKDDIDLPIFHFMSISNATNNFSESNKLGQGGFGPVYKGMLPDGQEIAVKRLSKTSGQGLDEFKNEVMLIAKLQHRNLVKLLGCSIQQDEKLLVYEFMANRSLDYFIFDSTRRTLLSWAKRFEIIGGIARGLLYLHQDSRLKIIHRDLKTGNVLLDSNMNPKISDFGMARTFGQDQHEANTNRVMGTYGYMSPEYAGHGSFSVKSDVFSFGVIVLEIISGRKNRGFCDADNHINLLGHAWRLWIEKRAMELKDESVDNVVAPSEILRHVQIGLLCVQQRPEDRPNMSSVVLMLNGEKLLPEPSQPGFYIGKDNSNMTDSSSTNCEPYSLNQMSNSLFHPR